MHDAWGSSDAAAVIIDSYRVEDITEQLKYTQRKPKYQTHFRYCLQKQFLHSESIFRSVMPEPW